MLELEELLYPADAGQARPFVDVAIGFSRSGGLRSAHVHGHNLDSAARAESVARATIRAVRPLQPLLEPLHLRLRIRAAPRLSIEVLPPWICTPHVRHEDDAAPPFVGHVMVRSTPLGRVGDHELQIEVRLHIAETGALIRLEPIAGDPRLLDRVEEALKGVGFDPALINGHPISGTLDLTFDFRP